MTRRSCSSFPLVAWFSSAKRRVSSAQKKQIVKDRSRAEESGRKGPRRIKVFQERNRVKTALVTSEQEEGGRRQRLTRRLVARVSAVLVAAEGGSGGHLRGGRCDGSGGGGRSGSRCGCGRGSVGVRLHGHRSTTRRRRRSCARR